MAHRDPKQLKNWPLLLLKDSYYFHLAKVDDILATRPMLDGRAAQTFAEARALLESAQWPEATRAFGKIALANPRDDVGMVSAMLYLEGLMVLAIDFGEPRSDCRDELREQFPQIQRIYCDNGRNRLHPQECYSFFKLERDLEVKPGCGANVESKEPPEVLYARAAAHYLARARRCLEATQLAGVSPLDEFCDEDAFYAAKAYLKVPDFLHAAQAWELLVNPHYGMTQSQRIKELAKYWDRF